MEAPVCDQPGGCPNTCCPPLTHNLRADLLGPPGTLLRLPAENILAACNTIAFAPAAQVAAAAARLLEELRQTYLAGASDAELLAPAVSCGIVLENKCKLACVGRATLFTCNSWQTPSPAPPLQARTLQKMPGACKRPLLPSLVPLKAVELAKATLQLMVDASLAAPELPPPAADGKRALPPAPPPALRGSVAGVPDPLRPLFGSGGGSGPSALLRRLLRDAVESLPASTALAVGPSPGCQEPPLPLVVSPDIDFGTVAVSRLTARHLVEAAASAASGLPSGGGSAAAAAGGSLLDLLHLASSPQQAGAGAAQAPLQTAEQPGGSSSERPAEGLAAGGGRPGSVFHFRQLVVDNCSSGDEVWLLGGVAAPSLPHTLAAVDDARLFWREGAAPGGVHAVQRCSKVGRSACPAWLPPLRSAPLPLCVSGRRSPVCRFRRRCSCPGLKDQAWAAAASWNVPPGSWLLILQRQRAAGSGSGLRAMKGAKRTPC